MDTRVVQLQRAFPSPLIQGRPAFVCVARDVNAPRTAAAPPPQAAAAAAAARDTAAGEARYALTVEARVIRSGHSVSARGAHGTHRRASAPLPVPVRRGIGLANPGRRVARGSRWCDCLAASPSHGEDK